MDEARPTDPDRAARAEAVFLEHLAGRPAEGAGGARELEDLCRRHPELAGELRLLHSGVEALQRLRGRIEAGERARDPVLRRLVDELARGGPFERRFETLRAIGAGGQGEVVEALERALGRAVAVKRLRPDLLERPGDRDQLLARFLAEAQITAQLDHPGVVAVHELSVDGAGRPYFTMTRVRGRDLREVFERRRAGDGDCPLVRCLTVLQRVCETMSFAHARGVVHRDLKPANVMVGSFGEVYVMDWGLARAGAARGGEGGSAALAQDAVHTVRGGGGAEALLSTQASENLGTVFYMAPEVASGGSGSVGPTVDVYAVGAMLYELLAGRPPYWPAAAHAEVLERIRAGAPEPLERRAPAAARELVSIAARAMAREPAERYADMAALEADLRAFLEDRVVRAHASGPLAELQKWVARNRKLAGALALALLALLGGLAGVAAVAARGRARLDVQADLFRLPYLEAQAARLWPETPATVPAYEAWLATADKLVARLELHRAALAELRGRALAADAGGPDPAAGRPWRFADPADQVRHDTLAPTVAGLEAFAHPETGLRADVRRRLAWASAVEERTLHACSAAWERARAAAADPLGPYGGFALAPILGLVPLGPDPRSRLEEFALARSGAVPARDERGELGLDGGSALVLVLVPGGRFHLGAQAADPAGPGYDPQARPEEGPPREVALDPFLIAKHELTQGQWARLGGGSSAPAGTSGGPGASDAEDDAALDHPVDGVSWSACVERLARFGLTLPSEAQWEYAARAGSSGPFLGHADASGLAGAVNLADATVLRAGLGWPQAHGMEWLDDGFARHAPVGSFAPNAFGLHDVLGNVWEWCLDVPGPYTDPLHPGTGLRLAGDGRERVARGGGYVNNAAFARVSIRDLGRSNHFDSGYHGLRPVLGPVLGAGE